MKNYTLNNLSNSSNAFNSKNNSSNYSEVLDSDIQIITLDDSLTHPYFKEVYWSEDNYPSSTNSATIIFPYSEYELDYWQKYSGVVNIHATLDPNKRGITANQSSYLSLDNLSSAKERVDREKLGYDEISYADSAKRNQTYNYNYSFIGKVIRAFHEGDSLVVIIEDLGWKFSQKVPKKFRDSYVSGQTLDNAFQAMCEFMGIEFAYSIEDLNELEFAEDGYSIKKDGEIIEDVPNLFEEWANKDDEESEEDELNDETNENVGLIEYNTSKSKKNNTSSGTNKSLANLSVNNYNNDSNNNSEEEDDSTSVIDKIQKYQAEFDEKIKNLFIGNVMYDSDLSSNVLNYSSITIPPSAGGQDDNTSTEIEELTEEDENGNIEE